MKTKTGKKERIFQIVNTVLVVGILSFYIGRLFYYKAKLEKAYTSPTYSSLSDVILDRNDPTKDARLYENEDGTYSYKGAVTDNYVLFNNELYRILGIDKDGNIRLVSENCITDFTLYETTSFETTSLYRWLNTTDEEYSGIYASNLSSVNSMLAKSDTYYNTISDPANYQCEATGNDEVTILSLQDYLQAGGSNSFINNDSYFWLCNQNEDGEYYYVDNSGALGIGYSANLAFGVRPVITLTYSVKATGGSGTATDPFVINTSSATKVSELSIGDVVSYSGYSWKVEEMQGENAILIMEGVVQQDGADYKRYFGSVNYWRDNAGIGLYLNEDFLATLQEVDSYLVENQWYFGTFDEIDDYDYTASYATTYTAYVGIPNTSFRYLNEYNDYYLANNASSSEDLIYIIKDNTLYGSFISDENYLRPVICMKGDIVIASGAGTASEPYQLEVSGNAEETN